MGGGVDGEVEGWVKGWRGEGMGEGMGGEVDGWRDRWRGGWKEGCVCVQCVCVPSVCVQLGLVQGCATVCRELCRVQEGPGSVSGFWAKAQAAGQQLQRWLMGNNPRRTARPLGRRHRLEERNMDQNQKTRCLRPFNVPAVPVGHSRT